MPINAITIAKLAHSPNKLLYNTLSQMGRSEVINIVRIIVTTQPGTKGCPSRA